MRPSPPKTLRQQERLHSSTGAEGTCAGSGPPHLYLLPSAWAPRVGQNRGGLVGHGGKAPFQGAVLIQVFSLWSPNGAHVLTHRTHEYGKGDIAGVVRSGMGSVPGCVTTEAS